MEVEQELVPEASPGINGQRRQPGEPGESWAFEGDDERLGHCGVVPSGRCNGDLITHYVWRWVGAAVVLGIGPCPEVGRPGCHLQVWRQGTSLVEVVDPLEWRAVLEGVVMLGETRVLRLRPVLRGWAMLQAEVAFARVFRLCALLEGWLAVDRGGLRAASARSRARGLGPSAPRRVSFAAPWLVRTHAGAWPTVSLSASGDLEAQGAQL